MTAGTKGRYSGGIIPHFEIDPHAGSRKTYARVSTIEVRYIYMHAKLSHVCITPYTL